MGGSKGGSQTTTVALPGNVQNQLNASFNAANNAAGQTLPGVQAASNQATAGYQTAQQAGNIGIGAQSGNAADIAQLMNPYTQSVIGQSQAQFGGTADQIAQAANENAASQGAFGGSRAAVAQGQALGTAAQGQQQTIAGLEQSGYQQAQNQATNLANLGIASDQGLQGQGAYQQQILTAQQQNAYNLLHNSVTGIPGASTTTQTSQPGLAQDIGGVLSAGGLLSGL